MATTAGPEPWLASVVRGGAAADGSRDARQIADCIYLSEGVTNSYLVTTLGKSVLINAGSLQESTRTHRPRYRRIDPADPAYVVTTQSHRDHIGGVQVLSGPDTKWVASACSAEWRRDVRKLSATNLRGRNALWAQVLDGTVDLGDLGGPDADPDILVGDSWSFDVGGTTFELYATPGGETTDSMVVWLPERSIVFTSNLFGPAFGSLPNLTTLRGDKPRSAVRFISSLERVRALGPKVLITGHGEPITGANTIDRALVRVRDAVQYIHDQTIKGMNDGVALFDLMQQVRLPPELAIPQVHGKVTWCVRTIWHEYLSWFQRESTAELYPVPRSAVDTDLLTLAGADALIARAREHLRASRAVHSLHLTDIVLNAAPRTRGALKLRRDALELLLADSGWENLTEVMWLRTQIAATRDLLERDSEEDQL
jgi:alkyl sulfatase BDS1-like metallo-beta-lactamase superfamily hydrolase